MNAIERDKARKIVQEIFGIAHTGSFEVDLIFRAQSLLCHLIHKDGEQVDLRDVQCDIDVLIDVVREERKRRDESAELAAELSALESRKSA